LIAKEALIKRVLKQVILGFADQQLVTGLAILIAGYMKYCTISVYHFNVVTELAWLSSVTHLLSVSCLRGYFVEHPGIRDSRAIGMVCFLIMLVVSCVFEIHHNQTGDDWTAPLRCRFSSLQGEPYGIWIFYLSVLLLSYPINILRLYPESGLYGWCDSWITKKSDSISEFFEGCVRKNVELKHLPKLTFGHQCHIWANYLAILVCLVAVFVANATKFLFIDQCGYLYYGLGIFQLFYGFSIRAQLYPLDGSESTWGFG
jgi:hypothetical protein